MSPSWNRAGRLIASSAAVLAAVGACAPSDTGGEPAGDGWFVLFDGSSTDAWRRFQGESVDPKWAIEDGALALTQAGAGDIITKDEYENFELSFEWRISEGGNSGVFFNVVEGDHDYVWRTGPELQLLDNDRHADGQIASHRAGANFDLHAPSVDAVKPVGDWNQTRLVVNEGHVQHWMNGELVVEYDLWTPEWEADVAASKFVDMPDYGRSRSGHIALQDHGDRVWFRDIKIRPL